MPVRAHGIKGRNLWKTPIPKYGWKPRDLTKDVPYENVAIFSDGDKLLVIRAKPVYNNFKEGPRAAQPRAELGIVPSTPYKMLWGDD